MIEGVGVWRHGAYDLFQNDSEQVVRLAHKKQPPPQGHHRALGIVLL